MSAWTPNLVLFWAVNNVLLVLTDDDPALETAALGSGLTCFPVQLTDQSSHWEPNPTLPSAGLNDQLSWCPSILTVTSGREDESNQVSEGGSNLTLPIKLTILNGLTDIVLLVIGCSTNVEDVNGNVIKSPVFVALLLEAEL